VWPPYTFRDERDLLWWSTQARDFKGCFLSECGFAKVSCKRGAFCDDFCKALSK